MDAPERIWVAFPNANSAGLAFMSDRGNRTAYVRADLAAQMTVQAAAQVLLDCHTVQTLTAAGKSIDLVATLRTLAQPTDGDKP